MLYNNISKRWEKPNNQMRGIVYIDTNYIEYGYFDMDYLNIPLFDSGNITYIDRLEHCKVPIYWRGDLGCYSLKRSEANNIVKESKHMFHYPVGRGRVYNFSKVTIKPSPIKVAPEKEFEYIKQFTFGLEFETSAGNIPWLDCLENNLVPLYDGSINGHEYVTFPLSSNELPLIKQHLLLLDMHTTYDQDCSLHIHFGNFPIEYSKIESLCKFWNAFQWKLQKYIPAFSYYVERYKSNGKAYNKPLTVRNLDSFYRSTTGNIYSDDNSFYLPNLYDAQEIRKWEVSGRYYNMNIMHLISGDKHKTVEFRFLRPTVNYSEVKWYILILSAFLNYVINAKDNKYSKLTVDKVIKFTFPADITNKLILEGNKFIALQKVQYNHRDPAGINSYMKNYLLKLYKFQV